ncbi:MAG: hypothetical protein ACLFP0_10320 [Rhodosalinus sp.]
MADNENIARIQGAHELGLAFVRAVVLLNGGAFTVLLAYMAGARMDSLVTFGLAGLKTAMYCFLSAIVLVLAALLVSYIYTALNFQSPLRQRLDTKIIPINAVLSFASLALFAFGVVSLIRTAEVQ